MSAQWQTPRRSTGPIEDDHGDRATGCLAFAVVWLALFSIIMPALVALATGAWRP